MLGVRRRDQKKSAMLALLIGAFTRFIVGPVCLFRCLKDGWTDTHKRDSMATYGGLVLMLIFFVSVEIYGVTRHQRLYVKLRALARESILAWRQNVPQQKKVQMGSPGLYPAHSSASIALKLIKESGNEVINAVVGDKGQTQHDSSNKNDKHS